MSGFGYFQAVLLGVVQGFTEFLPISSSAHLVLTQRWLGLDSAGPEMLLFDVLSHLGSVCAMVVVFFRPCLSFVRRLLRESAGTWTGPRYARRIVLLAVLATIPTAAIGLGFKSAFESVFDRPGWIGAALITTGSFLAAMKLLGRARRGWRNFRWWQAVIVGIAQAHALLPGISRSGATICVARLCGLRSRWAAEFSFLIAVPAILGAAILKLKDTFHLPAAQLDGIALKPALLGSVVSMIVGVVALRILLDTVRRAKLHYFAPYCWILGGLMAAGALG